MAATFLDYAGAEVPVGMTSRSMRSLLDAKLNTTVVAASAPAALMPRSFVKSGLGKWRLVVQVNPADSKSYKLICCKGACPGSPSTAPKPKKSGYTIMLICVDDDPYDMKDLPGETSSTQILERMLPLLPDEYASGCK